LVFTLSFQVLWQVVMQELLILVIVPGFPDSLSSFLLFNISIPFTQFYIHPSPVLSPSFYFFNCVPISFIICLSIVSYCHPSHFPTFLQYLTMHPFSHSVFIFYC